MRHSRCTETPASPVSPHLMHGLNCFAYRATPSVMNGSCLSKAQTATGPDYLSDVTARCLSDPSYGPQNRPGRTKTHQTDVRTPLPVRLPQRHLQGVRHLNHLRVRRTVKQNSRCCRDDSVVTRGS